MHPFTLYLEIGPQFSSLLLETPSSTPVPHPGSEVEPETVFQATSTSHLSVHSEGFRVTHRTIRSSAQRCPFSPDDPGGWVQVPELLQPPVNRALCEACPSWRQVGPRATQLLPVGGLRAGEVRSPGACHLHRKRPAACTLPSLVPCCPTPARTGTQLPFMSPAKGSARTRQRLGPEHTAACRGLAGPPPMTACGPSGRLSLTGSALVSGGLMCPPVGGVSCATMCGAVCLTCLVKHKRQTAPPGTAAGPLHHLLPSPALWFCPRAKGRGGCQPQTLNPTTVPREVSLPLPSIGQRRTQTLVYVARAPSPRLRKGAFTLLTASVDDTAQALVPIPAGGVPTT